MLPFNISLCWWNMGSEFFKQIIAVKIANGFIDGVTFGIEKQQGRQLRHAKSIVYFQSVKAFYIYSICQIIFVYDLCNFWVSENFVFDTMARRTPRCTEHNDVRLVFKPRLFRKFFKRKIRENNGIQYNSTCILRHSTQ